MVAWRLGDLRSIGHDLLIAFAFAMLAALAGHMLAYGLYGTPFYRFLFPHPFLGRGFDLPWWFEWFPDRAATLNQAIMNFVYPRLPWTDSYGFSKTFAMVPLLEELEYRGPFWLTRRFSGRRWWRAAGVLGALVFTLAHGSGLGTLIPVFAMALGSTWLIAKTGRFWPSVALHAVYNMQMTMWPIALNIGS